jgi:signal transduction histidine kinase
MTIKLPPSAAPHPLFEVKDLAQDDRFSQLPFVQGEPYFRFYAGTPLTTKRGINVGSLCVMDTEVREGLNQEQAGVLGWLAGLVITHLEINREAIEGRRSKLMTTGLNLFVDGRSKMNTVADGDSRPSSVQLGSTLRSQSSPKRTGRSLKTDNNLDSAAHSHDPAGFPRDADSTDANGRLQHGSTAPKDRVTTSEEPSSEEETVEGTKQDETVSENHKSTFGRAANILRECFQMDDNEGVVFVEAGTGLTYADVGPDAGTEEEVQGQNTSQSTVDDDLASPIHRIGTQTSYDPLTGAFTGPAKDSAHVLAFSSNHEPFLQGQLPQGSAALGDIDRNVLHGLLKRYPHGKIWYLANGVVASSSEDDKRKYSHSTTSPPRKPAQHRLWEAKILAKFFPEARQILFVPMWDAATSRWASACFAWRASETRIFSAAIDLSFLSAFSKTIMAECSRLDTLVADKQKADFIGSISHELRSPLHGILAGAEFLSETATSVFQRSLIDTIEACGRTLLDTINHVLDFSKINSLDRNWRNSRQPRKRTLEEHIGPGAQVSAKRLPSGAPPLLRLYAVTDIAAITEEVVEGLSIGQIYSQATDLTDISASNRGHGPNKGMRLVPRAHRGHDDPEETTRDAIEVLLDIAKEDWIFTAQSGAIRRVIMNLFGK